MRRFSLTTLAKELENVFDVTCKVYKSCGFGSIKVYGGRFHRMDIETFINVSCSNRYFYGSERDGVLEYTTSI